MVRNTPAICHPNRVMRAKGLCASCYAHNGKEKFPEIVAAYEKEKELRMEKARLGRIERAKKRRDGDPFTYKSYKQRYGLTKELYDQMIWNQKGSCKICEVQSGDLVVEHCHKTKVVRGLVCRKCNNLLGYLETTSKEVLEKAKTYLKHFEQKSTFYSKASSTGTMDEIKW